MEHTKNIIHDCPEGQNDCDIHNQGYGDAISPGLWYTEEDGHWRIGNGEYSSCLFFCPYCGVELAKLPLIPSKYTLYTCEEMLTSVYVSGDSLPCTHYQKDYRFPEKELTLKCHNHRGKEVYLVRKETYN